MPRHTAYLAAIAACTAALATTAAASAETLTYTAPGTTTVTLPTGVTRVHVVAVGGRGGGLAGGYGAVVTADVRVVPFGTPSGIPQLRIAVAGNGGVGSAGTGGGGAAGLLGPDGALVFPTLAGGGGGASVVEACQTLDSSGACNFVRAVIAGGGGGAGGDGLPGTGGAGGPAGAAGSPGSSTPLLTAAGGGAAGPATFGSSAPGGTAGTATDPACEAGEAGDAGTDVSGGAGGLSADLAGHGDAGGGGGGLFGGGGGGGGAYCAGDDTGASGGGGGGGSSRGPLGAQVAADMTGQPSVTVTYTVPRPAIVLSSPADGAVYEERQRVLASYRCGPAVPGTTIVTCTGTVANRAPLDTTLGSHEFKVTAADTLGLTNELTVHYHVVDRTAPRIPRLRIRPRTIAAEEPGDYATVRFRLTEAASVRVAIHRVSGRARHAVRRRARVIDGHAGWNSFRLRARSGRRTLAPGPYRVALVATDPSGNRSSAVERRFSVVD